MGLNPLEDPHVVMLAKRHHCSPSQVIMKYLLELGFVVLTRAVNKFHGGQNILAVECGVPYRELWVLTGLAGLAHAHGAGGGGWIPHFVEDVFGLRGSQNSSIQS